MLCNLNCSVTKIFGWIGKYPKPKTRHQNPPSSSKAKQKKTDAWSWSSLFFPNANEPLFNYIYLLIWYFLYPPVFVTDFKWLLHLARNLGISKLQNKSLYHNCLLINLILGRYYTTLNFCCSKLLSFPAIQVKGLYCILQYILNSR